ncbi:oligosaccharide flippase family protein [Fibrobacter sp. UWB12]|uniref:oligosaccharide flippase family protein n=1 Tax=Fibrobacter sp. UWB12 TaxID=1896203 RepID=UPI0009167519|nr:oligosaccharide flippase family protein [Fibrobacter sp. UWB12]SHK89533.1 Membrane protein involved in the export of O-antigen and teichoic acid [Fibrobacter sp. UWB12]
MPISQIKIGAILSYATLALNNLVGLLYTPFMLRMLGKSEYGLYSIVASVIAYLTILDLGFGNAIVRYTAKFRAENKQQEQYQMFGMFFLLYCGISIITLLIGAILYLNAESIFDVSLTINELERTKTILLLMIFNLAITFPFSLFSSIITAYEQFLFQKMITIVRIILNTATMIVLLNIGYKAIAMVVVTTIFNILTLGINLWYCKHNLKIKLIFFKFQWTFLKEVSIYSFWIFLNAIMDCIYWSSGQIILGAIAGTTVVAVYAIAIQLQTFYMNFSTAINGVLLPKMTALVVQGDNKVIISDIFIKIGRIQYCVMALILSGFILFGQQFINLWAGEGYSQAYTIALLFFIPLTIPLIQNMGIIILQARNQMKFRCLLYLGISVASLALQIPLARKYGGIGCAISVALALAIGQGIVMNVYYQRIQKINIIKFWKEIFKMSIIPLLLCIVSYYILLRISLDSVSKLIIAILCYLSLYVPLFFKFSMNSYERDLVLKAKSSLLRKFV